MALGGFLNDYFRGLVPHQISPEDFMKLQQSVFGGEQTPGQVNVTQAMPGIPNLPMTPEMAMTLARQTAPGASLPPGGAQPMQPIGGDNPELQRRQGAGLYDQKPDMSQPVPGADKIAPYMGYFKNLPPELAMQALNKMVMLQAEPQAPILAHEGDVGFDRTGKQIFSVPKAPKFGEKGQGINPGTGQLETYVLDEQGNPHWTNIAPGPNVDFVNGQAVDKNKVATGTVIPPQEQGPVSPERLQQLLDIAKARGTQAGNVQSVQQAADGSLIVVHRDGKIEHMNLDGSPVKGTQTPEAVFNRSAAQSSGKAAGTAAEALPTTAANFDVINQTLNAFDEPAVKSQAPRSLGFGGLLPTIPGINSDFKARAEQLQGQAFLQAFNTLKGGGQITEVEGAKATAAIARLNKAQTPTEFYNALNDAKTTFRTLFDAAKTRASRGATVPAMQGGSGAPAPSATPGVIRYDAQGKRIP